MDLINYTLKELCDLDEKTKFKAIEILNKSIILDRIFKDIDKNYEEVRFELKEEREKTC